MILTKENLRSIFINHDPMDLIIVGAPNDEYDPEIEKLLPHLTNDNNLIINELKLIIKNIFDEMFYQDCVTYSDTYTNIAKDIINLMKKK